MCIFISVLPICFEFQLLLLTAILPTSSTSCDIMATQNEVIPANVPPPPPPNQPAPPPPLTQTRPPPQFSQLASRSFLTNTAQHSTTARSVATTTFALAGNSLATDRMPPSQYLDFTFAIMVIRAGQSYAWVVGIGEDFGTFTADLQTFFN